MVSVRLYFKLTSSSLEEKIKELKRIIKKEKDET
jgi:hypothetical protein